MRDIHNYIITSLGADPYLPLIGGRGEGKGKGRPHSNLGSRSSEGKKDPGAVSSRCWHTGVEVSPEGLPGCLPTTTDRPS